MALKAGTDFSKLWGDIKGSPALLIALGVGVIAVLYYVAKGNSGSAASSTNSTTPGPYYIADVYEGNGSAGQPTSTTSSSGATIRQKQTNGQFSGYDQNHSGVPLWTSPTGSGSGTIPFGATVSVLASNIKGTNHGNGGNYVEVLYNGQTGYVSSQDIA